MAGSRQTDFQAAKALFRNKEPEQALELARKAQAADPEAEDIGIFVTAVLKHLDARMRLAARVGDHAEVVRIARRLVVEPEMAETAHAALLKVAVETMSPGERAQLLWDQYRATGLSQPGLDLLGGALAAVPPERAALDTAFLLLERKPGSVPILQSVAVHMAGLGFGTEPPANIVEDITLRLEAACGLEALHPEHRSEVYARERALLGPAADPVDRLALEFAIRRMEDRNRPPPDEAALADNAWLLLDSASEHYFLRDPPPLSPAAQAVFARPGPEVRQGPALLWWRFKVLLSLWLRGINFEASQDRIGYLWLVLDPLIHVLIICAVPLVLHPGQVHDMPTFSFGVIGAAFWMACRVAASSALAGGGVLKPQLEHPAVRRFDIILARGLNALVVYFFVGAALLGVAGLLGLAGMPRNLPVFLGLFVVIWLIGLSYGIVVSSLMLRYPGVRRINGFVIRVFAFTSGLFFVSEQLPDQVSGWFLLNPVLHVIQMARSAWFFEYDTRHADPVYVFYCVLGLMVLALACLTLDERRPESVRA